MSIKSFAARLFAAYVHRQNQSWINNPVQAQEKTFKKLIKKARATQFGKDHNFENINTIADFQERVPIRDYEAFKPYVEKIIDGASDVLWPGKPLYFAKTSGTTSGAKYIPITKDSMPTHIKSARNAILNYIHQSKRSKFVNGKMIFLQGSPVLGETAGIKSGRLSGIVAHYVPAYLQKNRMPSYETNCIEDWETKVEKIIDETLQENMSIISGIPSWVQMYFERIQQRTGKPIGEVFPDFKLFIYGGVNYKPYKKRFDQLIGRPIDTIELFPASEGFLAYSTDQTSQDMLLLLNNDIFYEFIPADRFFEENPPRLSLSEVEVGVSYALILSSSAGLWAYNIGDTVIFTQKNPYKLIVSGRIKHFISAFGEHVIASEIEYAAEHAQQSHSSIIKEFSVAPQVEPNQGQLPYHEWFIEFEEEPENLNAFAETLDRVLRTKNSYYDDLIKGKVLQPLKITRIPKNGFNDYMKKVGKLGGQNKLPRLTNDRKIADELHRILLK